MSRRQVRVDSLSGRKVAETPRRKGTELVWLLLSHVFLFSSPTRVAVLSSRETIFAISFRKRGVFDYIYESSNEPSREGLFFPRRSFLKPQRLSPSHIGRSYACDLIDQRHSRILLQWSNPPLPYPKSLRTNRGLSHARRGRIDRPKARLHQTPAHGNCAPGYHLVSRDGLRPVCVGWQPKQSLE